VERDRASRVDRHPISVPNRGFACLLMQWAHEAGIEIRWVNRVDAVWHDDAGPVVIAFKSIEDRTALMTVARRKIGALDRFTARNILRQRFDEITPT